MLAIEVEYLMGRAVASSHSERDAFEWPPHPQRLFSAMVAAHFELECGAAGEAALRWFEALPSPHLCVDLDPGARQIHSHWVPVNDETLAFDKAKPINFQHLLDRRTKQERYFPAVLPADARVIFSWPDAPNTAEHVSTLMRIVEGVSYLGHSSSPVRACILANPPAANLKPDPFGNVDLRVTGPGRFDRLNAVYALRQRDESVQPPLGRTQRYRDQQDVVASSDWGTSVVLAIESGQKLGVANSAALATMARNALLRLLPNDAPPMLSGHDSKDIASKHAHLAVVPLPFVDAQYADGSIKGVAFLLPKTATAAEQMMLDEALFQLNTLKLGALGELSLRRVDDEADEMWSLRWRQRFAVKSQTWRSATPVVCDRFPKKNLPIEEILARSVERIGLPRPIHIEIAQISALKGSVHIRAYASSENKQLASRFRTHATLHFATPVRGPIVIGAGRFLGLGLFVPERNNAERGT